MKIERLLAITILLLNRRKVTAAELAEHFEVSSRTIYRDLNTLNHAGIPVISLQGFEGGFSIPDNFKLSRHLLTYNDMVSILTTLKGVNSTLGNRDINLIIEKISSLIPHEKQEDFRKQSSRFIIDISPWGKPRQQEDLIQIIHTAISSCRTIEFGYTTAQGQMSKRVVEPHTLAFKSFNWYLIAYCRLRQNFRVFRLSRIEQLLLHYDGFIRKNIDPLDFFQPDHDSRMVVDLVLNFSAEVRMRVEEMLEKNMLKYEDDGTITAHLQMPEDEWISSFILSFGEDVEVLSPVALRKTIKEKIVLMLDKY